MHKDKQPEWKDFFNFKDFIAKIRTSNTELIHPELDKILCLIEDTIPPCEIKENNQIITFNRKWPDHYGSFDLEIFNLEDRISKITFSIRSIENSEVYNVPKNAIWEFSLYREINFNEDLLNFQEVTNVKSFITSINPENVEKALADTLWKVIFMPKLIEIEPIIAGTREKVGEKLPN